MDKNMIQGGQGRGGYIATEAWKPRGPAIEVSRTSSKSQARAVSEALEDNLRAVGNFYRNDKFSPVTEQEFIDRRSQVDPMGLVPESSVRGIDSSKANITGKTVEIGTYNMEWLGCDEKRMIGMDGKPTGAKPRTDEDYRSMAQVIRKSGAEVLGIQEISDEKALQSVIDHLNAPDRDGKKSNFQYILGQSGTRDDGSSQRIGFIYNADKLDLDRSSVHEIPTPRAQQIANDSQGGRKMTLRQPLAASFKSKEGGFDFTLVCMHLKAGGKKTQHIRLAQAEEVGKWKQDRIAAGGDRDIIMVGDFNSELNSGTTRVFGEGGDTHFTTAETYARKYYTHARSGRVIDHIAVSEGGALEEYIPGTTGTINDRNRSSDHRMVVGSFRDVDNDYLILY